MSNNTEKETGLVGALQAIANSKGIRDTHVGLVAEQAAEALSQARAENDQLRNEISELKSHIETLEKGNK